MYNHLLNNIRETFRAEGKLVTIKNNDSRVELLGPIPLPRLVNGVEVMFRWYLFTQFEEPTSAIEVGEETEGNTFEDVWLLSKEISVNSILCYGSFESKRSPLVRVHSNCLTGEVFGSLRCDCGPQLEMAFAEIVACGEGAVVYMAGHEGRGIGLWAKGAAYLLQDRGYDTYESNRLLRLAEDSREYTLAALILKFFLGSRPRIRLLTNNPAKVEALEQLGIEISEQVTMSVPQNPFNRRYLIAKAKKGHFFSRKLSIDEDDNGFIE